MEHTSLADAYPLIRSGGVFLTIVGLGIVLGAANMRRRYHMLGVASVIAALATMAFAIPLSAPFGPPSALQLGALATSVVLEVIAFVFAGHFLRKSGERGRTLITLTIVAVHFFIMAPAFGPPVAALGAATLCNIAIGAAAPRYALPALWFSDGLLKLGAGVAMFYGHGLPCWPC